MNRPKPDEPDFGDVANRFALQRKPFVTLADVLDQLTEKVREFGKSRGEFEKTEIGACDLTIVDYRSSDQTLFRYTLGYDEEKFVRVDDCLKANSSKGEEEPLFSVRQAERIYGRECGCGKNSCPCDTPSEEARYLEKACLDIIKSWHRRPGMKSHDEWAKFLAAIFQLIYSGRNILPSIAGRVYEGSEEMDELGMSTVEDSRPVLVELIREGGPDDIPELRLFDPDDKRYITTAYQGEGEDGALKQIITPEQDHWSEHHPLYKWVGAIQGESPKWQAYFPVHGLMPFRGYLAVPCKSKSVALKVIEHLRLPAK